MKGIVLVHLCQITIGVEGVMWIVRPPSLMRRWWWWRQWIRIRGMYLLCWSYFKVTEEGHADDLLQLCRKVDIKFSNRLIVTARRVTDQSWGLSSSIITKRIIGLVTKGDLCRFISIFLLHTNENNLTNVEETITNGPTLLHSGGLSHTWLLLLLFLIVSQTALGLVVWLWSVSSLP